MSLGKILGNLNLLLEKDKIRELKLETNNLLDSLKEEIRKRKIKADVFIGGSFAKGTLIKEKGYDIDLFVRFFSKYDNNEISKILEGIITKLSKSKKLKCEKVHGSRDYFRIINKELRYEIIPVLKVNKPKEAKNVTDLSYFHVNYVKKRINSKIANQIAITKAFLKAQNLYGAESYIKGISGYGVECLLIYYKTFEKFTRALANSKEEKIIIDIEKQYKNNREIMIDLNESKSQGPIILIDPTWKERNVLAALSQESFVKLKSSLKSFLSYPSKSYFETKSLDITEFKEHSKKVKGEFIFLNILTNRQEGDIAGTKLKKFSDYLKTEIDKYFIIIRDGFEYDDLKSAFLYLIVKPKKEVLKQGPPIEMKKESIAFKKQNRNSFVRKGRLYSKIKISSCRRFIEDFKNKYKDKILSMDITSLKIK